MSYRKYVSDERIEVKSQLMDYNNCCMGIIWSYFYIKPCLSK